MVNSPRRRIFISHPYNSERYHSKIVNLLSKKGKLPYFDHSIPQNKKINAGQRTVNKKIDQKIRTSSDVIIIASNHASHRENIRKEIKIAKKYNKNIIAVKPQGQERISKDIRENATTIVGWNRNSINSAIRKNRRKR